MTSHRFASRQIVLTEAVSIALIRDRAAFRLSYVVLCCAVVLA